MRFFRSLPSNQGSSSSETDSEAFQKKKTYIDVWFETIKKPQSFYDNLSEGDENNKKNAIRSYFYNIDLQGRLFLEETLPKNIATSIKDTRFLDFFFKRVQCVDDKHREWMSKNNIPLEHYPYVSPCGKELNFIRPAATPIVFHSLVQQVESDSDLHRDREQLLIFAGNMSEPFNERRLAISKETGRLYHELTTHSLSPRQRKGAYGKIENNCLNDVAEAKNYGLIRSAVAVMLSERIVFLDDDSNYDESNISGLAFTNFDDPKDLIPIPWLPAEFEPGAWAMPFSEDGE